jgi:hypothetical protein
MRGPQAGVSILQDHPRRVEGSWDCLFPWLPIWNCHLPKSLQKASFLPLGHQGDGKDSLQNLNLSVGTIVLHLPQYLWLWSDYVPGIVLRALQMFSFLLLKSNMAVGTFITPFWW